ncbi:MAG: hypothetical protein ABI954_15165 [Pyrinomonadaceae bacterium]
MPLDSSTGVIDSRPTIIVGGQENASLAGGLMNLLITEKTNGLYTCEAQFGNWGPKNETTDFLYFDRQTLDFGKDFQVKLGQSIIFDGKITALEADFPEGQAPAITVLAEDALQNLRMTRRTRTFNDVADTDVFRQIAGDYGLTANINASGATHKVLAQVNQSDLAFMRERARTIDAEIWVSGKELNVKSRSSRGAEKIDLKYGGQLREFKVIADLAHQRTSVSVNGWDVQSKEAITHEAAKSILSGELGNDESGADILQKAFGERKEALAHTVPFAAQEAQDMAETYFKAAARRFTTGRGVAEPNAKLRVGTTVNLDGLGKLFNGKYYVCDVAHVFDNAKGLRTEFGVERVGIGKN